MCSLPNALQLMYCQVSYTWSVCSLDHKHKGKGMWFGYQQPFVGRSFGRRRKKPLRSRARVKETLTWMRRIENSVLMIPAKAKGKNFTSNIVAKFAQLYSYFTSSRSLEIPCFQMGRNFFPIYLSLKFSCFYNGSQGVHWALEIWEFTVYHVEFSD